MSVAVPPPATAVPQTAGGESEKGIIRVPPSVRLSSIQTEITGDQDAKVNLSWHNSELNEVTFKIEVSLDVPSGLYIYGGAGIISCAAGRCLGEFDAPPGPGRDMPIFIKSDRAGSYYIRLQARYWPEDNLEDWSVINLDTALNVREPSENLDPPTPESPPTAEPASTPVPPPPPPPPPWWLTLPALVVLALLGIVVIAVAAFWAIPRAVRAARAKPPRIDVN